MLIRMALALNNRNLEKDLAENLKSADVQLERFGNLTDPGDKWQHVVQGCADIIVISDTIIPDPVESGINILAALPEHPTTVVLHSDDSTDAQARYIANGAHSALYAGIPLTDLTSALEATVETRRHLLHAGRNERRRAKQPSVADFATANEAMQLFMENVKQVAASDSLLLLTGETGVGKEHLAKMIHAESTRSSGPFIAVNTAALPDQLLESELFGHMQGAFTGATRSRRGAFEQAHGGTIFLDEIGEMPLHLQAKLLRVLQEYEVHPLGAEKAIWVDVRVIAATNRDLEEAVGQAQFRKDLFYRLSVIQLQIPPLRERREDIPRLARRFLADLRLKIRRDVHHITEEAMSALCRYSWPGNVRELMNVIERSLLLCKTDQITIRDLPGVFQVHTETTTKGAAAEAPQKWKAMTLPEVMAEVREKTEKCYLEMLLQETRGNISNCAQKAGITTRSLYSKMTAYGLQKEAFKRK